MSCRIQREADEACIHGRCRVLGTARCNGRICINAQGAYLEAGSLSSMDSGSREQVVGSSHLWGIATSAARIEDGKCWTGLGYESVYTTTVDAGVRYYTLWRF